MWQLLLDIYNGVVTWDWVVVTSDIWWQLLETAVITKDTFVVSIYVVELISDAVLVTTDKLVVTREIYCGR